MSVPEAPSPTETIHVGLLGEDSDAWAQAIGRRVGLLMFEIVAPPDHSPAEEWEFQPGTIVVCELRAERGGRHLLAVRRAMAPSVLAEVQHSIVEFVGRQDPCDAPWIDTLVDGKPLEEIVAAASGLPRPKARDQWQGSNPHAPLPPNGSLLGGRGGVQLLVCADCREPGCDPVTCAIEVYDRDVVWSEFHDGNRPSRLSSVGPFVFDRAQHEAAVARAVEWNAGLDCSR